MRSTARSNSGKHNTEAEMLAQRRLTLGFTQQQVAEKAGIPLQNYQMFETGRRSIMRCSLRIGALVCDALGFDPVAFVREVDGRKLR